MVKSISYKKSSIKLITLKSKLKDFTPSTDTEQNKFVSSSLVVSWKPSRFNDNNLHIGIIVSKKLISKLATIRNLIKRRLKNVINENIRNYNLQGYDFIFIARSSIINISYEDLTVELNNIFKQIENKTNKID